MVEHKKDKSSTCGKKISNKQILSWEVFKLTLDMSEPTRSMENLKYSWDNLQSGKKGLWLSWTWCMSRIVSKVNIQTRFLLMQ
jgi:hypothetical protein